MRHSSAFKRNFIQGPRRQELIARRDLHFTDGESAIVTGLDRPFPHVSRKDGALSREYTWDMVDAMVSLGIAFPV